MTVQCFPRHIRAAKICTRGARGWFKSHNINWSEFCTKGVSGEVLRNTGDPFAERVVVEAEREAANGRG